MKTMDVVSNSDYIVYVDESGDHGMSPVNHDYPVFVLSFCIFEKSVYTESITPEIRNLKFRTFGHDMVILHEIDIRKKKGAFSMLSKEPRAAFMAELSTIMTHANFSLIAIVIQKEKLRLQSPEVANPYHLAMEYGLERVHWFLKEKGQETKRTYLIVEARGKREDRELEQEFERVCNGSNYFETALPFQMIIADKKVNSEGLQLADMTARPIGLSVLRPDQRNRAMDILEKKFFRERSGNKEGIGLKCVP